MRLRDPSAWMLGDALTLLEQAERLQRQFFRGGVGPARAWEPPVDVLESDGAILVAVALPGVAAADVEVRLDGGGVTVTGRRSFAAGRGVRAHRIEIPHGRFERRIGLPMAELEEIHQQLQDGCLVLTFRKREEGR